MALSKSSQKLLLTSIADFLFVLQFIYLAFPKGGIKLLQDADTGFF